MLSVSRCRIRRRPLADHPDFPRGAGVVRSRPRRVQSTAPATTLNTAATRAGAPSSVFRSSNVISRR